MAQGRISKYPIQVILNCLVPPFWSSRTEFVEKVGYHDLETGRTHLDAWLDRAEGWIGFLHEVAAVFPEHAAQLQTAITETAQIKAAEGDSGWRERCQSEEASWVPYIRVLGETNIPRGITLFGVSGGFRRWARIDLPEHIRIMTLDHQLPLLPGLMLTYKQGHRGHVPFFGKISGFVLVRLADHWIFNADGQFLEHVHERFPHATAWVELR